MQESPDHHFHKNAKNLGFSIGAYKFESGDSGIIMVSARSLRDLEKCQFELESENSDQKRHQNEKNDEKIVRNFSQCCKAKVFRPLLCSVSWKILRFHRNLSDLLVVG